MRFEAVFALIKETVTGWMADNATRMSAALAYYAIFSLAPLLVILLAVVGLVYGEEAARGQISGQVAGLVGEAAGDSIQTAVAATGQVKSRGIIAALVAFGVMVFGASTVFGELKNALNAIWGVQPRPGRPIRALVRDRLLSFSLVLGIGFLLLVSLTVSAVLSALGTFMADWLALPPATWKAADFLISLGLTSALFALIYKILPDVVLRWRDVATGALLSGALFTAGKSLIAGYLGSNSVASSFQAAGTLVVILLWVYYASGILFLGAEFNKGWLRRCGRGVVPRPHAQFIHVTPSNPS